MNILVVDDEKLVRDGISAFIRLYSIHSDYQIHTAENGYAAWEYYKEYQPEIVLVDVQMPGMSGLRLVERIKELSHDCITIVISGHADFSYAQNALRLGVTDYLLKPVSPEKFKSVFQNAQILLEQQQKSKQSTRYISGSIDKLREQFIARLMLETDFLDEAAMSEQLDFLNLNISRYCVGIIRLTEEADPSGVTSNELRENLQRVFSQYGTPYIFCNDIGSYLILLSFYGFADAGEFFRTYGACLSQEITFSLQTAFSAPDSDLRNVSAHYKEALLSYRDHYRKTAVREELEDPALRLLNQSEGYSAVTKSAIAFIAATYNTETSLELTAKKTYVHPAYLSDLFKRETGENFTSFINSYRVFKAKELLRQLDYKIYTVAEMVGYRDQRYFSTVFKRLTGLTPMEYREKFVLSAEK